MANIYIAVIGMGAYGIFAPWLGASILKKTGESERFWFFVLFLLNFWGFLFVLIRPSFRKGLTTRENMVLVALAFGYWAVIITVWALLGVFGEISI
jgi:hypothetical protein